MKAQFKTTEKNFEHLNFHDCRTTGIYAEKDKVIIDFEFVYISEEHPLNPYPVAKSTDACHLIFHGVSIMRPIGYIENQKVPLALHELDGMEFLTVTEQKVDSVYVYDIFGAKNHSSIGFHGLILHAEGFTMHWNEFTEDAWYVGWNQ
ncbi:hypothetical protein B0H99_10378 [Planomicrobium soli]|uniref:Uncharacterized protein n=1 Tax=Planomicrobium soli TaxID=1176648 RepID=A0A2P8H3Z8_9BACL|nr:hypothetical protein [Planomicrobium soli]PSL40946.1 hypothetical protein B0H99_10378 [Planomicrobium soli]